jgi:hypothetical protein
VELVSVCHSSFASVGTGTVLDWEDREALTPDHSLKVDLERIVCGWSGPELLVMPILLTGLLRLACVILHFVREQIAIGTLASSQTFLLGMFCKEFG